MFNRVFGTAFKRPSGSPAPGATITIFEMGTTTPITLYADADGTTPLANPFVADANAYWYFYAPPQRVDVQISGTGITVPYTLGDYEPIAGGIPATTVFNVQVYGAKADGATNDTAAVQAAITAAVANGSGIVYFPPGSYRLVGQLSVPWCNNIQFLGDDRASTILLWDDTATKGLVINTTAPAPVSSAFTVNGAIADRSVTVANGATFAVGNWAYMEDNQTRGGSLLTKIAAIVGNVVTLQDALPCNLLVASAATLYSYVAFPLVTGISVSGLTFMTNATSPASKLTLLQLTRCDSAIVHDCAFIGSTGPLITQLTNNGCDIYSNTFTKAYTSAGTAIETQASTGCSTRDNFITLCQFGIVYSSSPYSRSLGNTINGRAASVALGRGIKYQDQSNFGIIDGNNISDCNLFGVYLQDTAYSTVTGNTISFCGVDPSEHGIQIGGFEANFCHHNTVSGNVVSNVSGYGVAINPNSGPAVDLHNTISGNNFSKCALGAIAVLQSNYTTVVGNYCAGPGATVSGGLIRVAFGSGHATIVGNVLFDDDANPTTAINTSGGDGTNMISANVIGPNLSNNIHASDLFWATTADITAIPKLVAPVMSTTLNGTNANTLEKTLWFTTIAADVLSTNDATGFVLDAVLGVVANAGVIRVIINSVTVAANASAGITVNGIVTIRVVCIRQQTNIWAGQIYYLQGNTSAGTSTVLLVTGFSVAVDSTSPMTVAISGQNTAGVANNILFERALLDYKGVPTNRYA